MRDASSLETNPDSWSITSEALFIADIEAWKSGRSSGGRASPRRIA
jgi:hypothetical protein